MAENFTQIYDELLIIRKYLIKKGQSRYAGTIASNKFKEAEILYNKAHVMLIKLKEEKSSVVTSLIAIYDKIYQLFLEISQLCIKSSSENIVTKMDFDMRTACSLIPLMDGKEETTKRLIDAVDMYAEMLDVAGKKCLIKFVLKGRLSENAKLRLSTSYDTVDGLIQDMRKHLLVKKSFTAIQYKLQRTNQGWRSIDEYGSEIEKLFTDLTISQAEGDASAFAVLRPLNEKMAIKKFSDGLKDSRLSTIVAARNCKSLKDAIQVAKDEDMSTPSSSSRSADIMQFTRRPRGKYKPCSITRGQSHRGTFYSNNYHPRGSVRSFQNNNRGRFNLPTLPTTRFNSNNRCNSNWRGGSRNVFTAQENKNGNTSQQSDFENQLDVNKQFFRS